MHLSYGLDKTQRERLWEYTSKNHIIGLEHKAVKENLGFSFQIKKKKPKAFWKGQFNNFCEKMEAGDYVVILNGTSSILGIAKITEPKHRYVSSLSSHNESNPDRFFNHVRRNVEWKKNILGMVRRKNREKGKISLSSYSFGVLFILKNPMKKRRRVVLEFLLKLFARF